MNWARQLPTESLIKLAEKLKRSWLRQMSLPKISAFLKRLLLLSKTNLRLSICSLVCSICRRVSTLSRVFPSSKVARVTKIFLHLLSTTKRPLQETLLTSFLTRWTSLLSLTSASTRTEPLRSPTEILSSLWRLPSLRFLTKSLELLVIPEPFP